MTTWPGRETPGTFLLQSTKILLLTDFRPDEDHKVKTVTKDRSWSDF